MNHLKIILVIPHLQRGGAERVMSNLANQFHALGHQVTLVRYFGKQEYDVSCESINLELPNRTRLDAVRNVFIRSWRLRQLFKARKPDLIISFIGNLQVILTGFPVVVSIRIDIDKDDEFMRASSIHWQLRMVYGLPNVRQIVTVSKVLEEKLRTRFGLTRVRTIYNPLNFEMIDRQAAEGRPYDFPYILGVGSLKFQNGFDLLIEAYAQSQLRGHRKLVIVGEGGQRPQLEALIEKLGLQEDVILAGKQLNPFRFMRNAEFFVLSSRFEGFPNVLVEALACHCPCIATDCETGPGEIITQAQNGLLIQVNSLEALRDSMNRLHHDEPLRQRLAAAARPSVEHLEVARISERWLELAQ